ncbi:electron transport complex subunit RsxC [Oceanisphaera avium]|uniref:Ion-translocating oxidoreductase complex subunit C n=1 Tax=Oceanisphaera avium TaxID=1903694 RepID=A0A1Y0CWB5_9GAMM|nr:electron transport complex subunit RsxC [Oceanisphaera avium]ART79165.1 electron transport complex subunit RsxC [Oceanisphaera avium]
MAWLENLKAGQLHTFHGGIHPPQRKAPANLTPISDAGLPEELVLQVRQHIGQAAQIQVTVGEQVLKGQTLSESLNPMMVAVHAPTSGTIVAIEDRPLCHPSGLSGLCIVLKPDGQDTWRERFPVSDYSLLEPQALLARIHQAGITGLGGAGFPTHVKLAASQVASHAKDKPTRQQPIETLIINGVECEPYISADDRLMREHSPEILQGVDILRHIVKPTLTIIAVEDNKPEAIAALKAANSDDNLLIVAVPTKYPSGGQKQLIEILTGLQVPHKGLSSDLGIVMLNVGTVFAVQQAIIEDEPLIRRVVTMAGNTFEHPGNAWVYIGTPIRYLLTRYGLKPEPEQRIIIGGPMMGFTLHTAQAPIIKGCNCILAPSMVELSPPVDEMACIRCSKCADACPVSLLPQQLYWYARSEEHEKLESHNLFDCIECGACAYVCPSNIPLVQYYRVAKADIRQAHQEAEQAERAKERFEARQARLNLEKEERQARQAKAAAERKARMAEQTAKTGEDPVAAALARVKARQAAETPPEDMAAARAARKEEARRNRALKAAQGSAMTGDEAAASDAPQAAGKNPAVAAAIARAKARKAAQTEPDTQQAELENPGSESSTRHNSDSKKAAIQAAVARAKARKAAQAEPLDAAHLKQSSGEQDAAQPALDQAPARKKQVDHKKAAIKAAVARAKAKQEAELKAAMAALNSPAQTKPEKEVTATLTPTDSGQPSTDKQAAIKAAVARAKAKKLAQASAAEHVEPTPADKPTQNSESTDAAANKQAAIKAAVARAKAKKLAQAPAAEHVEPPPADEPTQTSESTDAAANKQAAIKAAVARAKARKAAQQSSPTSDKEEQS